jgi:hypothetical protein
LAGIVPEIGIDVLPGLLTALEIDESQAPFENSLIVETSSEDVTFTVGVSEFEGDAGDVLTNEIPGAVLSIRTEDVNFVVPTPGAVSVKLAALPTPSRIVPEFNVKAPTDA